MACDAQSLINLAYANGYAKLSQRDLLEALVAAACAGGGGGSGGGFTITSFTNNRNVVEIGSTVVSTVLTWVLAGTPTSQSIDQGVGALDPALRTKTDSTSYTANKTYTLTASDGITIATKTTSVLFESKIYWGVNSATSLTDPQILALSSQFATTFALTKTVTPAAQYIYFTFPTAFGVPQILVNGLLNNAWTLVTRAFVNASGFSTSYDIYRSNNLLTGTYIITLQ